MFDGTAEPETRSDSCCVTSTSTDDVQPTELGSSVYSNDISANCIAGYNNLFQQAASSSVAIQSLGTSVPYYLPRVRNPRLAL